MNELENVRTEAFKLGVRYAFECVQDGVALGMPLELAMLNTIKTLQLEGVL